MKTLVLTGPIGSGKSAVSALLRQRGIPVYDSDSRTKQLYDRRPSLVSRLEKELGTLLCAEDGKLDRRRLAAVIFADEAAREKLEAVVYPEVLKDFKRWKKAQEGAPFVVLESAVILSKPVFDGLADAVVVVNAPLQTRLRRVMERDGLSEEAVLKRMAAQELPLDKADAVLLNDGGMQALAQAVEHTFFDNNSYICKILNVNERK